MTATAEPFEPVVEPEAASPRPRSGRLRPGWLVVASKEFSDHLLSARFYVLLVILGIAALIPIYFAAERIRSLADAASGSTAVFLALFTIGPQGIDLLRVTEFVAITAPLLGVAFSFDAVNGERHEGTLPRLLSQPIHRDSVINGKFVAGLAIIAIVLAAVVLVISGYGLLRLGIVPEASEVLRLVLWYLLTALYVAMWLAFGMLLSVVIRRAATSALIGLGIWLFVAMPSPLPFGQLLASIAGGVLAPETGTPDQILAAASTQQFLLRLLPSTLYREASIVLLNPLVTSTSAPATLSQYVQAQQQLTTNLSLDQSLLVIWPHVVVLTAITVVCFALAYIAFMRQEVRA
ncbi:MAG TPA: ABC transporter permease [Candidatus Limnocylindrales bacterium]|nr:ABC transporter permease [Candidatus Limnocylindrales bacterium]